MSQFNEKEHLQNIVLLTEELAKILKNATIIANHEIKEIGDLALFAKNLLAGKRSPLLEINSTNQESRQGKYLLTYPDNKPHLHFIERQKTLQIPAALQQFLSQEDMDNMQKYGNVNRVIYVDIRGVATPKFVSLDKETNTLATMSAHKLSIANSILGVYISPEQKENLKQGNPILLKGLQGKEGEPTWDAIVSVDAVSKGLSFKKVTLNVPNEILGIILTDEQKRQLKKGESVIIRDLTSKNTGHQFSALINLNEGHLEIKPINDVPKQLLGLTFTEEQRNQLRAGSAIYLEGFTAKTQKKFDASISFDNEKGIKFDFNKQNIKQDSVHQMPPIEKQSSIPLLPDSAYKGCLKKTPSIFIERTEIAKKATETLQNNVEISPNKQRKKTFTP